MKHWMLLAALICFGSQAHAISNLQATYLDHRPIASTTTYDVDVQALSQFSLQVDLADAHSATYTFVGSVAEDTVNDRIFIQDHNLPTGLAVVLSTGANYGSAGLAFGTTYYVIASSQNYIKLAATLPLAQAGTAVDITAVPTLSSATLTLTPRIFASAVADGVTYSGSNDGVTFYSVTQSSVPYDAVTTGALTQFVDFTGKVLRLTINGPSVGALSVNAVLNGRR